ncbi:MAG: 1,4-beta-xylanase, partial [Oscillospiraceae bacterium]|nr:1,4-beta-xylanase [Oscillospiraceae bacterium]
KDEINKCASALKAITGQEEYLIRPPYLKVNDTFKQVAGVPLINCGVYSMDWDGASKEDIINTITSGMNNGTLNGQVVLVHENYETTAQAMEYLAPYMKSQGWQIVTVSEMFKANDKTMYNGVVYNNIW